ncbi:alpha-glucosidase [Deinococcus arboris]|uniref:alpha-glucosidase n=1 Tax=Deinococcus arboris TaxID=2682977 RepID=UPI0018DD25C3
MNWGVRRKEAVLSLVGVLAAVGLLGYGRGVTAPPGPGSLEARAETVTLGTLTVTTQGGWRVTRAGYEVWSAGPGAAFLYATDRPVAYTEARGMVRVREGRGQVCAAQRLSALRVTGPAQAQSTGTLTCPDGRTLPYTLRLRAEGEVLDVRVVVTDGARLTGLGAAGSLARHTRVMGGGEQFSTLNLRGRRLPVLVSEQGVGRGQQPLTWLANLTNNGAGGAWHSSYAPMPHLRLLDDQGSGQSIWSLDTVPGALDTRGGRWRLEMTGASLHLRLAAGNTRTLTRALTADTGRMAPLPAWTSQGALLGVQGGTARVREVYARVKAAGVPVAGLWLQDWVGRRTTSFGQQLWWNWELDAAHYPGWAELRRDLAADGVRVLGYVNPFLTDTGEKSNVRRHLYREAAERGFLLKQADGTVYDQRNTSFSAALVDLSNPQAYAWFKEVLRDAIAEAGLDGWMADFGESLPLDARPARGTATALHNAYPVLWARLNRELAAELGGDKLVFHRSAFTTSPGQAGAFWAGDQLVNWGAHDGLRSALTGLLSGGLSGMTLNHADAGGYTTVTQVPINIRRSPEVLARWLEFSAFTPLLRTHEGNRPADNAQAYDPATLPALARAARLYAALAPYRAGLMAGAQRDGTPLLRPVWFEFPAEPFEAQPTSYLLGPDLLVAPALRPGQNETRVRLPAGPRWVHAWTGQVFAGGQLVRVPSPLGQPAVFVREDNSALLATLRAVNEVRGEELEHSE